MGLRLYDTLTRKKVDFRPLDPANVRMYVCGPTVYDFAHIGNARPVIVFDVLFRLLRHLQGEEHVTYVRNITDVDDKINKRAAEEYPGLPLNEAIRRVTEVTEAQFHADVDALGCLRPTFEPRATEFVHRDDGLTDMVGMIGRLVAEGNAYVAEGHVLFDVKSWKAADGSLAYGRLSRRSLDEMIAGARVEVAPYKKDPMDFVLWKPSSAAEPGWDSPWGRGRPGWHIECSAMSAAFLGETFDIHGGGIDLVFPHHENEIAQSRCAFHTDRMASVWMHNGFLQVEGEKMSKSLGNFVTIRELLTGWQGYAWPGEALRFNMLRTHYREPIDWTFDGLDKSHRILWRWSRELEGVEPSEKVPTQVVAALSDDLNTPAAITELHTLHNAREYPALLAALRFLGFTGDRAKLRRHAQGEIGLGVAASISATAESGTVHVPSSTIKLEVHAPKVTARPSETEIQTLISARNAARAAKNWAEADRIRDELVAMGIVLMDSKDPATGELVTTWEVAR